MKMELSDELLAALEQIVGGKVYSVYFDPLRYKYDVGFEKNSRLQQKEVSKEIEIVSIYFEGEKR